VREDSDGGAETSMPASLRRVSERFQLVRDRAARLFERDPDFRDLCEEYDACARTLARHEAAGSSSEAMGREYTALMLRLERELLRHLEEHPERYES
jgi:hypothetical protein